MHRKREEFRLSERLLIEHKDRPNLSSSRSDSTRLSDIFGRPTQIKVVTPNESRIEAAVRAALD